MRAFLKAGQEMGKTGIERQRQRDFERVNIAFRLETMVRTGVRWVFDTPFAAERAALREIVRERLGGIAIEDEAALEEDAAYGAPDMESDLESNEDTASLVAEIGGPDVVANAISRMLWRTRLLALGLALARRRATRMRMRETTTTSSRLLLPLLRPLLLL